MGYVSGIHWTDSLIKEKLMEVSSKMQLGRMPTERECKQYFHNCALSNAIIRRGGWRSWAEKMELATKECETTFGKRFEEIAKEMVISHGYEAKRMPQNFPYDLLVDSCIKVDVKASHLYRGPNGNFYTFNLSKPFATCEIYLLFTVEDTNAVKDVLIVPSKFVISNNQISVGEKVSKYYRFKDRWDYFECISSFYESIII